MMANQRSGSFFWATRNHQCCQAKQSLVLQDYQPLKPKISRKVFSPNILCRLLNIVLTITNDIIRYPYKTPFKERLFLDKVPL